MGQKAAAESQDSSTKPNVLVRIRPHSAVDVVESVVTLAKHEGFRGFTVDVAEVLLSLRDDHGQLICTRKASK